MQYFLVQLVEMQIHLLGTSNHQISVLKLVYLQFVKDLVYLQISVQQYYSHS